MAALLCLNTTADSSHYLAAVRRPITMHIIAQRLMSDVTAKGEDYSLMWIRMEFCSIRHRYRVKVECCSIMAYGLIPVSHDQSREKT